jgi:hypothetical protein
MLAIWFYDGILFRLFLDPEDGGIVFLQHWTTQRYIPDVTLHIVACYLKAGIFEAEQTSIASQHFDNTHIHGNE